jgi:hypothetical protein
MRTTICPDKARCDSTGLVSVGVNNLDLNRCENGLAFFATDRWRIATNLWPKIASFQRLDLIHIIDAVGSIERLLRDVDLCF